MDLEFCIRLQFDRLVWSSWMMMKAGLRATGLADYWPEVWWLLSSGLAGVEWLGDSFLLAWASFEVSPWSWSMVMLLEAVWASCFLL